MPLSQRWIFVDRVDQVGRVGRDPFGLERGGELFGRHAKGGRIHVESIDPVGVTGLRQHSL